MEPTFFSGQNFSEHMTSGTGKRAGKVLEEQKCEPCIQKENYIVLDAVQFKDLFKEAKDVGINEYALHSFDEMNSLGSLKANIVKTGLVVATKCYNKEGLLISVGMCHFGNIKYSQALAPFLDIASSPSHHIEVLAIGMGDKKQIDSICERIKENPFVKEMSKLIHPRKISKKFFEKNKIKEVEASSLLEEMGYSLKIGFLNDILYVADKSIIKSMT